MTARRVPLAALVTVLGALLCIAGVGSSAAGMAHRYESVQTAITVREGEPPSREDGFVFASMDLGDGSDIDENIEYMLDSTRRGMLRDAELTGSFSVQRATMWADRETGSIVAVYETAPNMPLVLGTLYLSGWRPFAYMIPAFLGALTLIGGLFWLAARWQSAASDRHGEIDETRR